MIATKRITPRNSNIEIPDSFTPINVMSWSKQIYKQLSPFYLKTDGNEKQFNKGNIIFENFYQGSKVFYDKISSADGSIDIEKYKIWRENIWNQPKANRYPSKESVFCSLLIDKKNNIKKLDYISSRKKIYIKEYIRLITKLPQYQILLNKVRNKENIIILDMDVPSTNKKGYFGSLCNKNGVFIASKEKLELLINDPSSPFGHGLCIALILLIDLEIDQSE